MLNKIKLNNKVGWFIISLALLNFIQINLLELSFDEAYYWFFSNNLDWGYYDHPPMVALFIKMGTLLFGNTELGVRLIFSTTFIWILYLCWDLSGRKNPNTFILAVIISPLIHGLGLFALPDGPQVLFTLLFWKITLEYIENEQPKHLILIPLLIAMMFYSKYYTLLSVVFTTICFPQLFRRKSFWFIALLSSALYIPHLVWQYNHDFISFTFHATKRKENLNGLSNVISFGVTCFTLIGASLFIRFIKESYKDKFYRYNLLFFLLFLVIMSLRNKMEANWLTIVSIGFIIIIARHVSFSEIFTKKRYSLPILTITIMIVSFRMVMHFPVTARKIGLKRVSEFHGWKKAASHLDKYDNIVTNNYQYASKLSFYLNKEIYSISHGSRSSHYDLIGQKELNMDQKFNLISTKWLDIDKGKYISIHPGYKDPVFLRKEIKLNEIGYKNEEK